MLEKNKESCIDNCESNDLEFTFEKDFACKKRTAPSRWRVLLKHVSMIIVFCCALWLAKRLFLYLLTYVFVQAFYGARMY